MKSLQKAAVKTTSSGKNSTPKLDYSELLDLMAYQAYRTSKNHFSMSYPLVNICVMIIQVNKENKRKEPARDDLAHKFMVYSFRAFLRKWVMRNYSRIRKFFNLSIQGMHQDMRDVFQEVWICFFDLINKFDTKGDVFFVWYLNKYLYFWMNNKYKINKKEQVQIISLEAIAIDNDDASPISFMDAAHALGARSVTGPDEDEEMEDTMINKMMMDDFEKAVINDPSLFRSARVHLTYVKVYTYFFVEGKTNKSDLARQMRISQQKVRYYLDKISRMFTAHARAPRKKSINDLTAD